MKFNLTKFPKGGLPQQEGPGHTLSCSAGAFGLEPLPPLFNPGSATDVPQDLVISRIRIKQSLSKGL